MAKRGRPTVLKSYCRDNHDLYSDLLNMLPEGSSRTAANNFYSYMIMGTLWEAATEINYLDLIIPEKGRCKAGILEQLGRMKYQDGYSDKAVIQMANFAGEELHEGTKSKIIEKVIRQARVNNDIYDSI